MGNEIQIARMVERKDTVISMVEIRDIMEKSLSVKESFDRMAMSINFTDQLCTY